MKVKNMKCGEARQRLVSLADGVLSADEAEAVRGHLSGCADCRELQEQLQADVELLRREPAPEVPAFLATRIMAEVRDRSARDTIRNPGVSVMSLVTRFAAVMLIAVGIWLGTLLGRGMLGSQPSLDQQLAAYGVRIVEPGQ
jgi:anti-sigma factor RsiW